MTVIASPILFPVTVLVAWSLLMWLWMYATRLPAISRAGIDLDPTVPPPELMGRLPARVRWKADNYNHLMEQPTLFYAICLTQALLGQGNGADLWLAWGYVGLRVAHSLFQALINKIEVRFMIFTLSTLVLFALTIRTLITLTLTID
ncbi:MAPEG family protein [Microbulbifer sp. YPW16]|uniref:MAPEG family protein n=1 Tax=Microbulbifer sp. YPW16 TaxID=2904242 RepID=UPI001E60B051|nr:MAPEG family protein [Microbulbifer sp. YPW16]UHQ55220.1 MAPEG family protein [Microbulbifer sp. YPW16]